MKIVTVPCRSDNYAYLLVCEETRLAAVVDPSEAAPVLDAASEYGVRIDAVWNTHHHYDHVDGNEAIATKFSDVKIFAYHSDRGRVPGQTHYLEDGEEVRVGKEICAEVLFNPGHTLGAISYYLQTAAAVFTGDTLFAAGCGRLFEGSAEQMHLSLKRITSLSEDTKIYCGHEYTESNLRFAAEVEPGNADIADRLHRVMAMREKGLSTMGFTVAQELRTNVFVRTEVPEVAKSARDNEGVKSGAATEVFSALRAWKDRF